DEEQAPAGGDSGGAAATKDVTLLLSFPKAIAWLPLLVAEDQGYFEEEGLNVELQETEGSGFVTQQIIAGNSEFGWAGAPSDVIAFGKDPDLRVVACNHEKNIFSINVPAGSPISDVTQLRGKRLGITTRGGGEEPMVDSVLIENDMKEDVEIVPLGDAGAAVVKAIQDGEVDAFAGGYTDIATLEAAGLDLEDITPEKYDPMPGDCMVTSKEVLSDPENQDTAVRIIRAWAKGAFFAIANEEAALEISCNEVPEQCTDRERFTQPYLSATVELLRPVDESQPPTSLDPEGWQTTADVLLASGALDEEVDVDTLIGAPEVQAVVDKAYADVDQVQADAESDAQAYTGGG
ncbi:MAG: ABC transporter substrate-binding protein, partial [Solirubrobacteraceae bacterium]